MSVRTRSRQANTSDSKRRPPPPTFAPPSLPITEHELNVYIRNDKGPIEIQELKDQGCTSKAKSENEKDIKIDAIFKAPKLRIDQSNISETINVTLKPRKKSLEKEANPTESTFKNNSLTLNSATSVNQSKNISDFILESNPVADIDDEDDLVPEIRNKCNDVNEILNRILKNNDYEDEAEEINEDPKNPIEKVENIADITLDHVRKLLEEEEQANAKLKNDLLIQKEETVSLKRKKREQSEKDKSHTKRKSKKELQLEKMKNFLKDPDKDDSQDINLDIRLKKTDMEKEELSTDIVEVTKGLSICSFNTVTQLAEKSKRKVLIISDKISSMVGQNSHIYLIESEENLLPSIFHEISDRIQEEMMKDNNLLVTSSFSTSVSACICISFLVRHRGMQVREAVKLIEALRPTLKIKTSDIVKLEEWKESLQKSDNKFGPIVNISQTWLPFIFFGLLLFLVLRTLTGYLGIDRYCLTNFLFNLNH